MAVQSNLPGLKNSEQLATGQPFCFAASLTRSNALQLPRTPLRWDRIIFDWVMSFAIRRLSWTACSSWLIAGARDLARHPAQGAFFGLAFCAMANVLAAVFRHQPEYTMSLFSGCLLVGPFLAMGLYDISRRIEQGLAQDFLSSLTCWGSHIKSMAMLVLVLLVLELLWGRASLVIFAVFFNTGLPTAHGMFELVFSARNIEFLAIYSLVGGIFASLVYAFSVVSIPMILDRDTDAISASIASLSVFVRNWPTLLLWAACLVTAISAALMTPYFLGLVLVGPWLGHASWHVYRGCLTWPESVK